MGPIFNKKVAEKCNLWNPWTMHGCTVHSWQSQLLRDIKKKKKEKNVEEKRRRQNHCNPNGHLVLKFIKIFVLWNEFSLTRNFFFFFSVFSLLVFLLHTRSHSSPLYLYFLLIFFPFCFFSTHTHIPTSSSTSKVVSSSKRDRERSPAKNKG